MRATPKQIRDTADYKTGAKKDRCDKCIHVTKSQLMWMAGRYDRHCSELDVPVKTHGSCRSHEADEDAGLPRPEFPSEGATA